VWQRALCFRAWNQKEDFVVAEVIGQLASGGKIAVMAKIKGTRLRHSQIEGEALFQKETCAGFRGKPMEYLTAL
jgi:hypothetical protein